MDFSSTTHPFVNGFSVQQHNGFDCGVFAMLNCKRYVLGGPHHSLSQGSIKLLRVKLISEIMQYCQETGFVF